MSTLLPLKKAVKELRCIHSNKEMDNTYDPFIHDLCVLINEGLEDGFNLEEMTAHFTEYNVELRETNQYGN